MTPEFRARAEAAGLHADGSVTLNPASGKALWELLRWQSHINNWQLDEFCEAIGRQFGHVIDRETYTPGGPAIAQARQGEIRGSDFATNGDLVVDAHCGCEIVFTIESGFRTSRWVEFCDVHSPADELSARDALIARAREERDRRLPQGPAS